MEAVDRGKQVLVMTIDIGDGRQDFITIHEHDDPAYLAQEFSAKYNLDSTLQRNLATMIHDNTQEVLKNDLHMREPSDTDSLSQSPYLSPIKTENFASESRVTKTMKNEAKFTPSKGSIYGAVYKQLRKSTNSKSESLANSQSKIKKNGFNYGDYLYAKGVKDKEQAEKFKEMKKQELFEKEIHELTFSPLINTNSSMISPRVYDKPEDILMRKQKEKDEKLKKLKESYDQTAYKECVFVPKINKTKSRDSLGLSKHKELYLQAEQRKERREKKIEEEFKQLPFKPDVGNARKKNMFETTEQFLDRLETSKRTNQEELNKIRKQKESISIDQSTGQKLHKPLTSVTSDKLLSRNNSLPIWEYLYSQKDAKKNEIELSQQDFLKQMEVTTTSKKLTANSNKIYDDFRQKQYQNLFKLMDSDNDGEISANSINIASVEVPILKILTPFFEELEKKEETIGFDEFCQRMEQLYRQLNVEKRAILIKRPEKKEEEEIERKPFVSSVSMSLAEKKRSSLPVDFYERQSTITKMKEMRLQKFRDEKDDMAIQECPFKPLIKSK